MHRSLRNQGFGLLEIAIVLTIIALLGAAITGGLQLKENVKLKTIIEDVRTFNKALTDFNLIYRGIPGDLWNAASKIDSAVNGNGNEALDPAELLPFWQQLSSSGLLEESYDGLTNSPGTGLPAGPFRNSGYTVSKTVDGPITLTFSGFTGIIGGESVLTPTQAQRLDERYDDGDPTTGSILATTGTVPVGVCINAGAYDLTNSNIACILSIEIDRAF